MERQGQGYRWCVRWCNMVDCEYHSRAQRLTSSYGCAKQAAKTTGKKGVALCTLLRCLLLYYEAILATWAYVRFHCHWLAIDVLKCSLLTDFWASVKLKPQGKAKCCSDVWESTVENDLSCLGTESLQGKNNSMYLMSLNNNNNFSKRKVVCVWFLPLLLESAFTV